MFFFLAQINALWIVFFVFIIRDAKMSLWNHFKVQRHWRRWAITSNMYSSLVPRDCPSSPVTSVDGPGWWFVFLSSCTFRVRINTHCERIQASLMDTVGDFPWLYSRQSGHPESSEENGGLGWEDDQGFSFIHRGAKWQRGPLIHSSFLLASHLLQHLFCFNTVTMYTIATCPSFFFIGQKVRGFLPG